MKKLLLIFCAVFAITLTSHAQAVVTLNNNSSCTVVATMLAFTPWPNCNNVGSSTYFIPPSGSVVATAPAGTQWEYCRFGEPLCAMSGALIEHPPIGCSTPCAMGLAPNVNTSPACSCPTITGAWDSCQATIDFN